MNTFFGNSEEKSRYCWNCGEAVQKGSETCPSCGAKYDGYDRYGNTPQTGAGGIGWSDKLGDESIKKKKTFGRVYTLVFMVVVLLIIFIVMTASGDIDLDADGLRTFGMVAGVMIAFWAIWLLFSSGGKAKKDWEGTVVNKNDIFREHKHRDEDGNQYVEADREFIIDFRLANGKAKKVTIKNDNTVYDYLNIGDTVRYHGGGTDYYEKYDKSRDFYIQCVSCRSMRDIRENYCAQCGSAIIKSQMTVPNAALAVKPVVKTPPTQQPAVKAASTVLTACPSCGEKLQPGAKFCINCGQKVK